MDLLGERVCGQDRAAGTHAGPARTTATPLRDGSSVHLRRTDPGDDRAVLELLRSLSVHSRAMRFATAAVHLPSAARAAVEQAGVIAFAPDGRCVGHAWYLPTAERRAEIALVVADSYQRRGLGTILLRKLAEIASSCGIAVLEAYVSFDNVRMMDLLRDCGISLRTRDEGDSQRFELDITREGAHSSPPTQARETLDSAPAMRAAIGSDQDVDAGHDGRLARI